MLYREAVCNRLDEITCKMIKGGRGEGEEGEIKKRGGTLGIQHQL